MNLPQFPKGYNVLVTGGAGSIGTAVVKLLLGREAQQVVVMDNSELGLFNLKREILPYPKRLVAKLGDVTRQEDVRAMFDAYEPDVVIHAAAYKHVSVCEENPFLAHRVNVTGTSIVLHESKLCDSKFVLVSTDKAVRPSCVMGETKQQAEILTREGGGTVIRLCNVLGSSGSVFEIWRKQIDAGGMITVNDPEATRYFIRADRAATIILAAAQRGERGETLVPYVDPPMRLFELARKMGAKHIEIGELGPGEKQHEELFITGRFPDEWHPSILLYKDIGAC